MFRIPNQIIQGFIVASYKKKITKEGCGNAISLGNRYRSVRNVFELFSEMKDIQAQIGAESGDGKHCKRNITINKKETKVTFITYLFVL